VETKLSDEPRARSIVEKLVMHVVLLEPLEGISRGSRMRRMDALGSNDQDTTHQLKQEKLAIIELYHEKREEKTYEECRDRSRSSRVRGRTEIGK
jgi:hypothetical protein